MTTEEKNCFVISPIGEAESSTRKRSDQVLRHVIKPAVAECGYTAVRADEIDKPGIITTQVIQHVVSDPLVIADLTDRNPNVFYELAIRHAVKKPLVQLIQKGEQIPFDVAGTRTIFVDHHDLDSVAAAKQEIVQQIRVLEKDPGSLETPISVSLDLQVLRQSENPEERSLADLVSIVSELRAAISKIEGKITSTADASKLISELSERVASSIGRLELVTVEGWARRRHFVWDTEERLGSAISAVEPVTRMLILAGALRDSMPWVYELTYSLYRSTRVPDNAALQRDQVRHLLEMLSTPLVRKSIARDEQEILYHLKQLIHSYFYEATADESGLEGSLQRPRRPRINRGPSK